MEDKKLLITPAPHIRSGDTVPGVMEGVIFALVPAMFAAAYFFGFAALQIILTCILACVVTEALWVYARKKDVRAYLGDGSAVVTGILLAFTLPPTTPLWTAALGGIIGISLGKHIFGGLGYNVFNPALVGRAFLTVSFPSLMTNWVFDGVTVATPLEHYAATEYITSYWDLFVGSIGGCLGETSALLILLGGAYLLYRGIIDWRLALGYAGTVVIFALLLGRDPIFHLFSGGLILGAIFMITDPVTSPIGRKARWVYAIGAGLLVMVIRIWGAAPGGVLYSILLMNATVPLLDRYLPDRIFGEVSKK